MALGVLEPRLALAPDEHTQDLLSEDFRELTTARRERILEASGGHRAQWDLRVLPAQLQGLNHRGRLGRLDILLDVHILRLVVLVDKRVEHDLEVHLAVALREAERQAEAEGLRVGRAIWRAHDTNGRLELLHERRQELGGDEAVRVGVKRRPERLEVLDVVGRDQVRVDAAERGEVLEDDCDDQIEHHERADDCEAHEVGQRELRAAVRGRAVGWVGVAAALLRDHRVVHDL